MRPTNLYTALSLIAFVSSCQTAETGSKVVDRNRGEIIISSSNDQRSALPESHKDSSLSDARSNLEKAVKKDPKDVPSLLSLAQLQLAQDRFREAEETCQKVLRLDIKNQEAKKVLAQAALRQGSPDMAMIFLTALGGEQSRDSSVLNMLGLVSMSRNDSGDAMRLWKQALNLNANDISARMNLGVMYLKYRLVGQASTQFERILKVAPNHQDAKLHLAIVDGTRGNHEKSIETYKSILRNDSENPLALYNLAVSQKTLDKYDDALDSLKRYIKASPSKSAQTDQAFAMIEEINIAKQSKGEKVSDSDIRALASSLEAKKAIGRIDQSATPAPMNSHANQPPKSEGTKQQVQAQSRGQAQGDDRKKPTAASSDLGADKDVDELERELRAH